MREKRQEVFRPQTVLKKCEEAGLNEQEIGADPVEHPKFTLPLKPFTGDTVTLKLADPPFTTVALVGLTEAVKSETCSWAVTD